MGNIPDGRVWCEACNRWIGSKSGYLRHRSACPQRARQVDTRTRRSGSPRVPEKVVQQQGVNLLRSVGGFAYVLGTRRRRGDFHGTMQTPGIPDVYFFLPMPRLAIGQPCAGWWEAKAEGGTLRPAQREFKAQCLGASVTHVAGGLDALLAFLVEGGWLKAENLPHYRGPSAVSGIQA